jgi:NAD(P)-dependent dehydrogenase (short-subunit alcohol dehydrogenase family)
MDGIRLAAAESIVGAASWLTTHPAPPTLEEQPFQLIGSPNRYGSPAFCECLGLARECQRQKFTENTKLCPANIHVGAVAQSKNAWRLPGYKNIPKAGVIRMTTGLASAESVSDRVTCLAPGRIATTKCCGFGNSRCFDSRPPARGSNRRNTGDRCSSGDLSHSASVG